MFTLKQGPDTKVHFCVITVKKLMEIQTYLLSIYSVKMLLLIPGSIHQVYAGYQKNKKKHPHFGMST